MSGRRPRVAVALHDVEPQTLARCRVLREWLHGRAIARATLLVIPAPRGEPLDPDGELAAWLRERGRRGDAVAQHGLLHARTARPRALCRRLEAIREPASAEFAGLDGLRTVHAVGEGRRIMGAAGFEPRGFVAPAYRYTRPLRRELAARYEWWSDLVAVHSLHRTQYSPALCLGASTAWKRATSPPLVRGLSRIRGPLVRVDIHPVDFDYGSLGAAIERALDRAERHTAITYDQLVDR
jgi:uncharacterized protein